MAEYENSRNNLPDCAIRITEFGTMMPGNVSAEALASDTPLSFWGGVDVATGMIQDVHHDLCGENTAGKVLCIPYDRGSCSGSGIIFEMLRQGTNPAAILCIEAEAVLALGPVIGERVYRRSMPIRTVSEEVLVQIRSGDIVTFTKDAIIVEKR